MIGQTKFYSKHQDIVDQYLKDNDPYINPPSIPFDLHGYLDYVSEHHIEDPDKISAEIMSRFFNPSTEKASEAS